MSSADTTSRPIAEAVDLARRPARWWRAALPAAGALWLLAPFTTPSMPLARPVVLALAVGLIAIAVVLLLRAWSAEPLARRRAWVRNFAPTGVVAVVLGTTMTVLGVAIVLVLEVPESGLAVDAWQVLVVDRGTFLLALAAAVPLTFALHAITDHEENAWLARRGLPSTVADLAAAEIRRLRIWRTLPAVLGLCVGFGASRALNLVSATQGPTAPAYEPLVAAKMGASYDPVLLTLCGYLFGAILAELTRRGPMVRSVRAAQLAPRDPSRYVARSARLLPVAVSVVIGLLLVTRTFVSSETGPDGGPSTSAVLVLIVLGTPLIAVLQRWLLRRRQALGGRATLSLDDTFRSSAAHAVVGSASAIGLVLASALVGDLSSTGSDHGLTWWNLSLLLVAAGLYVAVFWTWLRLGAGYVGRRPDNEEPRP